MTHDSPCFRRAYVLESHKSSRAPHARSRPHISSREGQRSDERIAQLTDPARRHPTRTEVRMATSLPVRRPNRSPRPRHPAWADVPDSDWNDWRWQAQHAVRHAQAARRAAPLLRRGAARPRRAPGPVQARDPALLLLADRPRSTPPTRSGSSRSPRRSSSPAPPGPTRGRPARRGQGLARPRPDPPLPDRALLVTTHVCTMYCRFCTRKRATMKRGGWDSVSRDDRRMVEYVARPPRDPRRDRLGRRPAHAPAREARLLRREPDAPCRTST